MHVQTYQNTSKISYICAESIVWQRTDQRIQLSLYWIQITFILNPNNLVFSHSLVTKHLYWQHYKEAHYHPISMWLRWKNSASLRVFFCTSAFCISVLQYLMVTCFDLTNDLKWWYFRSMCLVWGENLSDCAILMKDWLSSGTVYINSGAPSKTGKVVFICSIKIISGITSRRPCDKAMYYALAVLRAISVWSFGTKLIGHPAHISEYPFLDSTFSALSASAWVHPPGKLSST